MIAPRDTIMTLTLQKSESVRVSYAIYDRGAGQTETEMTRTTMSISIELFRRSVASNHYFRDFF